jgi:transposase
MGWINAAGMKALSMDLRERVAKARGTGSSYEVAARFAVHDSWVRRIWIRLRVTGSVAPLARGGNRARKVDPAGEALIRKWIDERPDLTIDEIRDLYFGERQVAVSEPAMRRTLNRMGLSRKKDDLRDRARKRTRPRSAQRLRRKAARLARAAPDLLRRERRQHLDESRVRSRAD